MESPEIDTNMETPATIPAQPDFRCRDVATSNLTAVVASGIDGVQFSPLGLQVEAEEISSDAYNHLFRSVLSLSKACNWLLGDTLLLGERQWGNRYVDSKYEEAEKATGMSRSTIRDIVMVCRAYPRETRHPELSFSHHREAAVLGEDFASRENMLTQAAKEKQSVRDLRKVVRRHQAENMTEEEKRDIMPNDDRPFGFLELPTKQEAEAALPIAFELDKALVWLSKNPPETLTQHHREELKLRFALLEEYARSLEAAIEADPDTTQSIVVVDRKASISLSE